MMNFIILVVCIVVANLITIALLSAIMLNRVVLKKYSKHIMRISEEIQDEIIDEMFD